MVTFNGRITLPPEVRKELGLKTGDNVDFVEVEKGRFAIRHLSDPDQAIQKELDSALSGLRSEIQVH
jgi:AbrB family looped-hinge helix DNA binding protein